MIPLEAPWKAPGPTSASTSRKNETSKVMGMSGPLVLAILDGWGVAPAGPGNPISQAKTPVLDSWVNQWPSTTLLASGTAVGLNPGQDGNSEAGHMNLGAGRVVPQESVRISNAINDGTFFRNPAFLAALRHVRKHNSTLHIMGMLGSNESAHADPDHLLSLLMFVQNYHLQNLKLHLFTDGRDSPRFFAREMLTKMVPHFGDARVATLMGRFYAMDRNKTWSRTQMAYEAITQAAGAHQAPDALTAITQAYNRGESDEFIKPTIIDGYTGMHDGDAIIFFNLRSDRARQITKPFVQPDFETANATTGAFHRQRVIHNLLFVAMTDFGPDLDDILSAFPALSITATLPMVLKNHRQLYIAESEKYAHVTYFFNGGYPNPVNGESREIIPSPAVKYYDQVPAMSTEELTARVCAAIERREFDVIVMNFANTDMVAHTGNFAAGIAAMEAADGALGKIAAALHQARGLLVVTGDHGNLEEMIAASSGEVDTEHSSNPVPFWLVGEAATGRKLRSGGRLGDVAPTILELLGVPPPSEMTGRSLIA